MMLILRKQENEELNKYSKISNTKYHFFEGDISDNKFITKIFDRFEPKYVVNLAAQAGVRYSIENRSIC